MMTTFTPPDVQTQLARFSPADTAIAELAEEYLQLTITGLDDQAGYNLVHRARMDVKGKRVAVERTRKELKADALAYGRKIDAEANRLTALLEPIEAHLLKQEKAVDDEKERIKNAARLKAEEEARARAKAEETERKAAREAEDARLLAEQERLRDERRAMEEEQKRIAAEQKAAQDKLNAERLAIEAEKKRLADIEADRLRAEEMKRVKADAAEKARAETEAHIAREAVEKAAAEKARAEAEEAARKRAEVLRPDREKLLSVAAAVGAIVVPAVSAAADLTSEQVKTVLVNAEQDIRHIVKGFELGTLND